jgi:hypothetical protein
VGDLVLRTRIYTAQRNLERVCALEEVVARGQSAFNDLTDSIQKMGRKTGDTLTSLSMAQTKINALADAGPEFRDYTGDEIVAELQELAASLQETQGQLRTARKELSDKAHNSRQNRVALLRAQVELNDLRNLGIRAKALINKLNERSYWAASTGQESIAEECDRYFDEYVELLRGMALREVGYGDDDVDIGHVFAIADQMPRLWAPVNGWAWGSLALPARMEQNALTDSGVLRIGFPEWTIWALPLVQHDFGRMFVNKRPPDAVDDGLLADACATIVTGPAYACAALLLRLDPQRVRPQATETLRSATIIRALLQVTELSDNVLSVLANRLREEWHDAVGAAGAQPELFDEAIWSPPVEAAVERAVKLLSDTTAVLDGKPCWATAWPSITGFARQLKDDKAHEINLPDSRDAGSKPVAIAYLLNAAWLARVGLTRAEEVEDSKITVVARGALNRLSDLPQPRPAPQQRPGQIFSFGG